MIVEGNLTNIYSPLEPKHLQLYIYIEREREQEYIYIVFEDPYTTYLDH
jgi:hypothetical protein